MTPLVGPLFVAPHDRQFLSLSLIIGTALLVGCNEPVTPEPLGDYTTWKRFDVTGNAPGHSDSYRVIYINDLASDPGWDLYLGYQEGSVIVKEVRDYHTGAPGDLRYVAIMRRIGAITTAFENEGGWLFSESSEPGGSETHAGFCWSRCHVAAPYNGAWYDYRR
jgi:hypothetical protein